MKHRIYRDKDKDGKDVGTYMIDRRFNGDIGRVKRASGTTDRETFKDLMRMLEKFYNDGKHTILREIRDKIVHPMEVYSHWIEGTLDHLASSTTLKSVIPTISDWIDTHDLVPTTKRNYKSEISRFCKVVDEDLAIQNLPKGLKKYRNHCIETTNHRTFNNCRKVVLSFLNRNFGKSHPLYGKVSDIPQLKLVEKRKAPQLLPMEIQSLIESLPSEHADIVRAMIFSGMRWTEVIEEGANQWWLEKDRIVIKGTKNVHSDRVIPLIQEIHKPTRGSLAFRKQLKKFKADLSPQSFRRSYAHWMEMARIPTSRKNIYMGHTSQSTTERYERHVVDKYLQEDAETLRNWILDQLVDETIKEFWGDSLIKDEPDRTTLL